MNVRCANCKRKNEGGNLCRTCVKYSNYQSKTGLCRSCYNDLNSRCYECHFANLFVGTK
jgi:hypothetical protein